MFQQCFISNTESTKLKKKKKENLLVEHLPMSGTESQRPRKWRRFSGRAAQCPCTLRSAPVEISVVIVWYSGSGGAPPSSVRSPVYHPVVSSPERRCNVAATPSTRKLLASGQPSSHRELPQCVNSLQTALEQAADSHRRPPLAHC